MLLVCLNKSDMENIKMDALNQTPCKPHLYYTVTLAFGLSIKSVEKNAINEGDTGRRVATESSDLQHWDSHWVNEVCQGFVTKRKFKIDLYKPDLHTEFPWFWPLPAHLKLIVLWLTFLHLMFPHQNSFNMIKRQITN